MQVAQLYLGMWMAGGVLAMGSLLVGSFGRDGAAFSPSGWVCAGAAGLSLGGLVGTWTLAANAWLDGQLASLGPSLGVGACAGLLAAWLQRRAAASVEPATDSDVCP